MSSTELRPDSVDRTMSPMAETALARSRRRAAMVSMLTRWPALVAAAAVGIFVVGVSYRLSASGAPAQLYYLTFWAGVLLALLPGAWLAVTATDRHRRGWALALVGLITFVPKYLRNPFAPSYHDEYAHWYEALQVLSRGRLFQGNALIPIVEYFPGTAALTAAVTRLTGLSPWSSGELIILVAHLLALFGVFVLVEAHLRSARAGAIAALIYALNPSEMYFDTQYAYEGIAVAFFVWVLAMASLAARARGPRRFTLTVAALLCAGGAVVTHHLTTVFLLGVLSFLASIGTVRAWRRARRSRAHVCDSCRTQLTHEPGPDRGVLIWWAVLAGTVVMAGCWLVFVAWPTVSYLSPYFGGSLRQLAAMTAKKSSSGRVLLAASVQPLWERGMTALVPLIAGLFSLKALLMLRRERGVWPFDTLALMAFGLLYFPSVLFLFAPSGAEGARRSWAFSFVGLALIGAYLLRRFPDWGRPRVPARWRTPIGLVVLTVLLIGGVGGGLNDPYRFPGPFRWGTDTNSASAEARTVGQQLAAEAGPVRVVADQYTALQLIAYADLDVAAPSQGFPAWALVQSGVDPSRELAGMLYGSRFNYLVVDVRMAEQAAFNGTNYGSGDPLVGRVTPMDYLDRLDHVPWASRIISTQHLRVYRLNLPLLGQRMRGGQ
jgi:hypothetical protein